MPKVIAASAWTPPSARIVVGAGASPSRSSIAGWMPSPCARRRAGDHALDARDLRHDHGHERRREHRVAAAGNVGADRRTGMCRWPSVDARAASRPRGRCSVVPLGRGERPHLLLGEGDVRAQRRRRAARAAALDRRRVDEEDSAGPSRRAGASSGGSPAPSRVDAREHLRHRAATSSLTCSLYQGACLRYSVMWSPSSSSWSCAATAAGASSGAMCPAPSITAWRASGMPATSSSCSGGGQMRVLRAGGARASGRDAASDGAAVGPRGLRRELAPQAAAGRRRAPSPRRCAAARRVVGQRRTAGDARRTPGAHRRPRPRAARRAPAARWRSSSASRVTRSGAWRTTSSATIAPSECPGEREALGRGRRARRPPCRRRVSSRSMRAKRTRGVLGQGRRDFVPQRRVAEHAREQHERLGGAGLGCRRLRPRRRRGSGSWPRRSRPACAVGAAAGVLTTVTPRRPPAAAAAITPSIAASSSASGRPRRARAPGRRRRSGRRTRRDGEDRVRVLERLAVLDLHDDAGLARGSPRDGRPATRPRSDPPRVESAIPRRPRGG